MPSRRLPTDIPPRWPRGRSATIRVGGTISATEYMLDFDDPIGGPEIGHYSGAGTLSEGQRVRAFFSSELHSWEIQAVGAEARSGYEVPTAADDGHWQDPGSFFHASGAHASGPAGFGLAYWAGTATGQAPDALINVDHAFLRFTGVALPATVPPSYIRLRKMWQTTGTGTFRFKIAAEAADAPAAPTTDAGAEADWTARTTAAVDWDFAHNLYADGDFMTSPDIASILQEIRDRPGYVQGGNILLMIHDDGSDQIGLFIESYDTGYPPTLYVGSESTATEGVDLVDLGDLAVSSPASGQVLIYQTADWQNKTLSGDATLAATGALTVASTHAGSAHHAENHASRHAAAGADAISAATPLTVRKNTGADVGTRRRLNFIEGTNVTLTVADDAGSDEVDVTIAAAGGAGGGNYEKTLVFGGIGTLSVGRLSVRLHAPRAMTIQNVTAAVNTAPTGASLIVDVNKNGTTIFTTQANRPTIAAGATEDLSSTPDVTAIAQDDVITVDVDQVGSTVAGADLVVQIRCTLATE